MEEKTGGGRPSQKLMDWMMDTGNSKEGTTTGGVELIDIWTCQKADILKKNIFLY